MSFFNKLQKALGFSYEDESMETQPVTTPFAAAAVTTHAGDGFIPTAADTGNTERHESPEPPPSPGKSDGVDVTLVFKGVVEVLNRELPPFLKSNLYEEGQRKFIYDSLDEGIKAHLAAVEEAQRQKSLKMREQEREKGRKNFEELKEKLRISEEHYSSEKEKAMSAERQKRALSSRINDLESRIATLEAEKEQFEMENRSLLNKLRVAEVTAQMGDPEHLQQLLNQIDEQKKQLEALSTENGALKEEQSKSRQQAVEASGKTDMLARDMEKMAKELETIKALKAEAEKDIEALKTAKETAERDVKELKAQKEEAEKNARTVKAEAIEWKTKYEQTLLEKKPEPQPMAEKKASSTDAPLYDFISFDAKEQTVQEPTGGQQPNVKKPVDLSLQSEIKTPEVKKQVKEEHKPKKTPKQSKPVRTDMDELLDDTDWLLEAGTEMENPDLVVPPQPRVTPEKKPGNNDYPSQMSLW